MNKKEPKQLLLTQLTNFIRYVRENDFNVGIQENVDCQQLSNSINIIKKQQFKYGLKTILCTSAKDWKSFDTLFDKYWQNNTTKNTTISSIGGKGQRISALSQTQPNQTTKDGLFDIPEAKALDGLYASNTNMSHKGACATESVACKNFDQLKNHEEMYKMEILVEKLAKNMHQRLLRRQHIYKKGKFIDIRNTLHDSLRYGGLPLAIKFRKHKKYIPKIVLLLDVSRSMSIYSYLFLRFARGVLRVFKDSDVFAFHTHLIHIAKALKETNNRKLVEKMAILSAGWEGGTRIDSSLKTFNQNYANKTLNSRSIVIIVSDGYDTGKPQDLVEQLKIIKRRTKTLIWLNPLLGLQNYSPSTQCMQAALPLIDLFKPAYNLQSFADLETHFAKL